MTSAPTLAPVVLERPAPPPGPVSFEAFLAWTDEDTHAEWVAGEIIVMSPSHDEHQDVADFLVAVMRPFVEEHRLGWLRSAPFLMRLETRPSGREPDLLFVKADNRDRIRPTYLDGPADLAVEIVSPDSVARDRGEKFVEYETAGVAEYWLIDPLRQEALFYQRGADGRYRRVEPEAEGIYRSAAVAGFWLRVAGLWQRPLPPVLTVIRALGL